MHQSGKIRDRSRQNERSHRRASNRQESSRGKSNSIIEKFISFNFESINFRFQFLLKNVKCEEILRSFSILLRIIESLIFLKV